MGKATRKMSEEAKAKQTKLRPMTEPQRFHLEKYRDGNPRNERASGVPTRVYDSLLKHGYVKRYGFMMSAITVKGLLAMRQGHREPVIPDGVTPTDFASSHPEILGSDAHSRTGA